MFLWKKNINKKYNCLSSKKVEKNYKFINIRKNQLFNKLTITKDPI